LNAALGACFDTDLSGISLSHGESVANSAIGAEAHAEGSAISLGSAIDEHGGDLHSMEVIGHEVAHALAGGGSGQTDVDQPGDPGERAANRAGAAFRGFIERGGPAPSLEPARGGRARRHRWASGEHADSVDGAADRVAESRAASGQQVDNAVLGQMGEPVTLDNGVVATPGQITAMMGDHYGVFDDDGNFDPESSFEQMSHADPRETRRLQQLIEREQEGGEVTTEDWMDATTRWRPEDQDSYLDLAARNESHFSAEEMEGTDNNMGTYSHFHQMALRAAAAGNHNQARAMEASAMHYLTDRHAAGHQFDRSDVGAAVEAGGPSPIRETETGQSLFVHVIHDEMNDNGVQVHDAAGASWTAMGDGHWSDESNAENRARTSESVYASYSELNAVMTGAAPADVTRDGLAAHNTVPQFDPEIEAAAERRAGELRVHEVLGQEVAHLPDALGGMLQGHRNRTRQRQGTPTPDHTPSVMHRRGPLI